MLDLPNDTMLDLDTRLGDVDKRILKTIFLSCFNELEESGDNQFADMSLTERINSIERLRQSGLIRLVTDGDEMRVVFPGWARA